MSTLIRDLIELPEQVHRGDFVLRLTEGVERPDATVSTYVVTPQLADSFDNALAETVNGYYKSELIYGPARTDPWKTVEDVELATLSWVHWHNTARLHGYLNDLPPTEFEAIFYATKRTDQPVVEIQ